MAIVKKFRIKSFKKNKPIISLNKVSIAFNKNHQILDNISLDIPKGQILGLLGPNGAGKSTLMNIVSGLIKPNYGSIIINGIDTTNYPVYLRTRKFKISIIPQFGGLFSSLSAEENMKAVGEIIVKDKVVREMKIENLISKFELDSVRKVEAKHLSGGLRRRLVIAMGLIGDPEILLMDEPLAALDPQTIQMLQNIIVTLQSELNLTIIITDHQARDLLAVCDKALILSNSKIVCCIASQLINDENANKFYFGKNFKFNALEDPTIIKIEKGIKNFNKEVNVSGDKSLSIRFLLLAPRNISKIYYIKFEYISQTIKCLKSEVRYLTKIL